MAAGSILIIEDEIRLRNNLQILLSRAGYTVTTAGDGRDGIACLQHASFDVVITDLMMHEVDGFKAMEYIGKPFDIEMLQVAIERALEKVSLQRELQAYRQDLEHRVAERTQALEETNRQLHRSLTALQSAHEQFMQTEKLSALGELIAGAPLATGLPLPSNSRSWRTDG
jgi:putative two-component system response regulator